MGSHDAVCGISGMAIGEGREVVTMMIRRNPRIVDTPLSAFDTWQPASPLVRGYYDDGGTVQITEEDRASWTALQENARQSWRTIVVPANEHGPERKASVPTRLDYTYTVDGERQRYLDDYTANEFALWMAHADIYDYLKTTIELDIFHMAGRRYMGVTIADALADARVRGVETMRGTTLPEWAQGLDKQYLDDAKTMARLLRTRSPWEQHNASYSPIYEYYNEELWDAIEADDGDTRLNQLLDWWSGTQSILMIFENLRRQLHDPGFVGSQHGHDGPFNRLAQAMQRQIQTNREYYGIEDE